MPTRNELRDKLCKLLEEEGASFGSDALAGELVDVIERGGVLRLDPEEPIARPPLPREVKLVIEGMGCYIRPFGRLFEGGDEQVRVLDACAAAYNRER